MQNHLAVHASEGSDRRAGLAVRILIATAPCVEYAATRQAPAELMIDAAQSEVQQQLVDASGLFVPHLVGRFLEENKLAVCAAIDARPGHLSSKETIVRAPDEA
ncbi:MAG TPA: hypothetical protein VGN42_24585 [Pirellulales bacterium]|nr:hypothetical protein [Pirellulales bacterium]